MKQTLGVLQTLVQEIRGNHVDWASQGVLWASEVSSDPLYNGLQNESAMHERADSVRERSEDARKQLTEMEDRTQEYEKYLQQTTTSRSQTGASIKMRRNQAAALTRKLGEAAVSSDAALLPTRVRACVMCRDRLSQCEIVDVSRVRVPARRHVSARRGGYISISG